MATLSLRAIKPRPDISPTCTPPALRKALAVIFSQIPSGLWLVGGTALAGYYAEHRRSDDLDLFACDEPTYRATIAAVQTLRQQGAQFSGERSFPAYFHVDIRYEHHTFTIDVVLDERIHTVGRSVRTKDGVTLPDLPTLFMMKCATLVSRCSEKDLYDLVWLFERGGGIAIANIIQLGQKIDGGLTIESLLISIHGAQLHESACGFVLHPPRGIKTAYRKILTLRKQLVQALLDYETGAPDSDIAAALRAKLT